MLCRTASDLFWMGRAAERAEAMARLLDLARRLAALPSSHRAGHSVWALPLLATGSIPPGAVGDDLSPAEMLWRCLLERDNPSSVLGCVQLARDAARNQRSVVPAEVVAPLQVMLSKLRDLRPEHLPSGGVGQVIGELMAFSDMFRGVAFATMSRNEAWHFLRLGTFLERADGALRLWATQADPEFAIVRDGPDSPLAAFHRVALLEAASALMPLRRLHGEPNQQGVTEMLLRRHDFPRSAAYCLNEAQKTLRALQVSPEEEASRLTGKALASVSYLEPRPGADAMFAFGAARQRELCEIGAAVDQRFFVAQMPLRRVA
jgi:uncharacterized alpha-E superfamily protein